MPHRSTYAHMYTQIRIPQWIGFTLIGTVSFSGQVYEPGYNLKLPTTLFFLKGESLLILIIFKI